jgi:hypothetical protein
MAKHWIKSAIKRPGAFKRKAKAAKMSVEAFARKERRAPGKLGKQARLALTLKGFRKGGRIRKGRR